MPHAPDDLIAFVDRWQSQPILVAGDFMLDRYTYGNADRLSPDAPVPVLAVAREERQAGGAANVCLDLRALRCEVFCLGVVGADDGGHQLRDALAEAGCDVTGLITTPGRPTTVKHNFVGLAQHRHPAKMFRVDHETRAPLAHDAAADIVKAARTLLPRVRVLCLEDYNKGVLTPEVCAALIQAAREVGVPVMVDPAAIRNYGKYRGATTMTPNRTEAADATGINADGGEPEVLRQMASRLHGDLELETIVLTLDKQGMLLHEGEGKSQLVPTRARAVYDVTGAGDMVLAMLAASRANGASWHTAVELANIAAGLEVEKFGVVPIPLEEILLALLQDQHQKLGKLRKLHQLLPELAAHRRAGRRIVFTNGCFDILHAGHVRLLREARAKGDVLVLAVNSDASITALKGPTRPIVPLEDRLVLLAELQCVDYLVTFGDGTRGDGDTPRALIEAILPDVLVKGGDYRPKTVVGYEAVVAAGGDVAIIPLVEGRSTTDIVHRIQEQRAATPRDSADQA